MRIVIAGGSGFIGRSICQALSSDGHHTTVLTRSPAKARATLGASVATEPWDLKNRGSWESAVAEANAVINLIGEPIAAGRWTGNRKRVIRDSRLSTTRALVEAMAKAKRQPGVLINASGVGFYGPRDAMPVTEKTKVGKGFLADLCLAWEREAAQAEQLGVRVVLARIGMVLGRNGGALSQMLTPFRMFVGGPIAPGHQWVSWIHVQDVVGLIRWTLANDEVRGPVNFVAPGAVTMREFCQTLGRVLRRPSWISVPEFALRVGLGELASMLTTGQRVEPSVALRGGYIFAHPALAFALHDILDPPMKQPNNEKTAA